MKNVKTEIGKIGISLSCTSILFLSQINFRRILLRRVFELCSKPTTVHKLRLTGEDSELKSVVGLSAMAMMLLPHLMFNELNAIGFESPHPLATE